MVYKSDIKAMITGAAGFVGYHLISYLNDQQIEVLPTHYMPTISTSDREHLEKRVKFETCDIRDKRSIKNLIEQFEPTVIFHLASQSFPAESIKDPRYTIETNIIGTSNLFESIKELKPFHIDPIVISACSSGEYGEVPQDKIPIKEDYNPLRPLHPYGIAKLAQESFGHYHFKVDGIKAINIRIFNTTGPRKKGDICGDFTRQAIQVKREITDKIRVGNLTTKRAITDVRDLVQALFLAYKKCEPGEVYNVSGNTIYSGQEILDIVLRVANINPRIVEDPNLIRAKDERVIFGDSTKFKERTGWEQKINLEQTITDMLHYFDRTL